MARIVKEQEYAARRKEILDAARKLVYTRGFDRMTIQDLLDELHISKGAFYHYFESKPDVQEALIERMVGEDVLPLLESIVNDPHLTALEKIHAYFGASARWKIERKELIISMLRVWYSDENIIFRHKLSAFSQKQVTPMLGDIVRQGIREGVFETVYPEQIGQMIIYATEGLSDTFVDLLINADGKEWDDPTVVGVLADYVAALSDTIERILGAPQGSIHLIEPEMLKTWFVTANHAGETASSQNEKEYRP